MKVLGLILARGGSKGIPRKNIKPIAGKPLIAWTIESAMRSCLLDAVVVSTEDEEIASVARHYGAQTPFMRPAELADDDTPGIEPVLHALSVLPGFDAVMLLQPTSPLRAADDIDSCIRLAKVLDVPRVVSVCESETHPFWMYSSDENQRLKPLLDVPAIAVRQELPTVFALNGAMYFSDVVSLQKQQTFITGDTVAYVMPPERSVDIDTEFDWKIAELLLRERT